MARLIPFIAISSVLLVAISPGSTAYADPSIGAKKLLELDETLSRSGTLGNFLVDPTAQNEYFQKLQDYYGSEKFSREAYDAILKQLINLIRKVPEIENRLWETTNLGLPIEITTKVKTSGRELNLKAWELYYAKFQTEIQNLAKPVRKRNGQLDISKRIEQYQANYVTEFSRAESESASLPTKVQRTEAMAEFFKRQRELPETRALAAFLLLQHLSEDLNQDALRSGDADIILDAIDHLRKNLNTALILPKGITELPTPVQSAIRDLLPTNDRLLRMEDVFPVVTKLSRDGKRIPVGSGGLGKYTFDPIPRRFHGIWKGVSLGECVGGGDLNSISPERWATIVLDESQLFNVHQGESYLGFVQIVPIAYGKKVYGSVDFGAGVLSRKIIGESGSGTLFDLWFKSVRTKLPKTWSGLVASDSGAIDNAGVLSTVRISPKYGLGTVVGKSRSFRQPDPLGRAVVKASPKSELSRNYGGRMIFDGMVKDAENLTLLIPADPKILENPRKVIAALRNGKPGYRKAVLKLLKETDPPMGSAVLDAIFQVADDPTDDLKNLARTLIIDTKNWNPDFIRLKSELIMSVTSPPDIFEFESLLEQFAAKKLFPAEFTDALLLAFDADPDNYPMGIQKFLLKANLSPENIDRLYEIARADTHGPSSYAVEILAKKDARTERFRELLHWRWKNYHGGHTKFVNTARLDTIVTYLKVFGPDATSDAWLIAVADQAFSAAPAALRDVSEDEILAVLKPLLERSRIREFAVREAAANRNYKATNELRKYLTAPVSKKSGECTKLLKQR